MSLDAIAAAACVSKPTIYRRWAGKQELVADAIRCHPHNSAPAPDTGSLRGDLLAAVRQLADQQLESAHITAGLASRLRGARSSRGSIREHAVEGVRGRFGRVLAQAVGRGELPGRTRRQRACSPTSRRRSSTRACCSASSRWTTPSPSGARRPDPAPDHPVGNVGRAPGDRARPRLRGTPRAPVGRRAGLRRSQHPARVRQRDIGPAGSISRHSCGLPTVRQITHTLPAAPPVSIAEPVKRSCSSSSGACSHAGVARSAALTASRNCAIATSCGNS